MKNNHFLISYSGNKRRETEDLYNEIKNKLDDGHINTIIEPFCGTSAFSYYISTKYPGKFKYILNDNNKHLIKLYQVAKDPHKLNELILKLKSFVTNDLTKKIYNAIVKNDVFENWVFKHKYCFIRPGIYPTNNFSDHFFDKMKKSPILTFLRNENITFYYEEGIKIINEYKDVSTCLMFLDPPYILSGSSNDFHYDSKVNIVYEYLSINVINDMKALILLSLEEDNWIIGLMFKDYIKSIKNKSMHLIISNII